MDKPIYIVVTPFFPTPESWRGAFCYDFVKALVRTGRYDVRVFVHGRRGCAQEDYMYNGVKVHRFRFHSFPAGLCPFFFEGINRRSFLKKAKEAGVAWSHVAVYHAHELIFTPYVKTIKRMFPSIKVLVHNHNGPLYNVRTGRLGVVPLHADLMYVYFAQIFRLVDLFVCVSERQRMNTGNWYANGFLNPPVDVRKSLMFGRWFEKWSIAQDVVLYNGYDKTVFNPTGRNGNNGKFTIGCVGNINRDKDQLTLLRAINRLNSKIAGLKVILVGSGDALPECLSYVAERGLGEIVEFKKEVDHLQLPGLYRSFDLFVIPSHIEGFCCSYIEAYGCGTPFMGCRGVSVEEAIPQEDWDRWLFPPKDDARLAELIESYWRERYPQRLARDFDIDKLVDEFVDKLERM